MNIPDGPSSLQFGRQHRLGHDAEYDAVYATRVRKNRPPFSMSSKPNALGRYRLGLSIPKKVGSAPRRNRFKRLIREAFRLEQHGLPGMPEVGYDIVIGLRAHEVPKGDPGLERVRAVVVELAKQTHEAWKKRSRASESGS